MYLIFDCILKFMFYFPFFLVYGRWLALIMIASSVVAILILNGIAVMVRKTIRISKAADSDLYDYSLKMVKAIKKPDFEETTEINQEIYKKKVYACNKAWIVYCNWANLYGGLFNFIWYIGVAICFCVAFNMMAAGVLLISTFIVFNSYVEQLKVPLGNYVSFKQVTDAYDESFKNVFDMLDDEDIKDLKNSKEN